MMRTWLLAALLAALTGCGAYWFYQNFSLVSDTTRIGFQGEARDNPLLAAERFLNTPTSPTKSLTHLTGLPPPSATLVMPAARFELSQQQISSLQAWVRAGGHLIVVPVDPQDADSKAEPDALLRPLGVYRVRKPVEARTSFLPTDVDLPAAPDFMQVSFSSGWTLQTRGTKPDFSVAGEGGTHLLRYRLDRGDLTVLSDAYFMQNGAIGRYDNAAFLWYLTHFPQPGEIWLIRGGDMPPLWQWLWVNAGMVLLSAALLLVAWLWSISHRFGPLRVEPPLARRRLLDHIDASGRFLWRHGQRAKLLNGARAGLLRVLESRHPGLASQPAAAISIHLADLSKSMPDTVQKVLFAQYAPNEYEFTEAIRLLETIRKSL
ncbi:MAG: DUF4350 domain-containing protein [Pseudomonadota bacterium]